MVYPLNVIPTCVSLFGQIGCTLTSTCKRKESRCVGCLAHGDHILLFSRWESMCLMRASSGYPTGKISWQRGQLLMSFSSLSIQSCREKQTHSHTRNQSFLKHHMWTAAKSLTWIIESVWKKQNPLLHVELHCAKPLRLLLNSTCLDVMKVCLPTS